MNAQEEFSPGPSDDIAPTPVIAAQAPDHGEIVAPVPLDAPRLGVKFKGRKPDEVLWFLNEKGGRLFAECRWNLEGGVKEVRPACFTDQGWKLAASLEEAYDKAEAGVEAEVADVRAPRDIKKRVTKILKKRPTLRWDAAVEQVLGHGNTDEEGQSRQIERNAR
jgi:hypothetical protein